MELCLFQLSIIHASQLNCSSYHARKAQEKNYNIVIVINFCSILTQRNTINMINITFPNSSKSKKNKTQNIAAQKHIEKSKPLNKMQSKG